MVENFIAKSVQYNIKKVCIAIFIAVFACAFFLMVEPAHGPYLGRLIDKYTLMKESIAWGDSFFGESDIARCRQDIIAVLSLPAIWSLALSIFASVIVYFWFSKTEMIVTDKRVYGTGIFGKRVDLPFDSISAVGAAWPKGIAVATSSGKVAFLMVKNRDELHKAVTDLLLARQSKSDAAVPVTQEVSRSEAEELKKYKELLDNNVISREEFDAKKKQLLGL